MTKYGAKEDPNISTPADGPVDWMVKMDGRYVLRIQRHSYVTARADAATILKVEWDRMVVAGAAALLKDSRTRSGVRKAIRRIPYVKVPKASAKVDSVAALRELNSLLASGERIPKRARLALFRVTQMLCAT